MKIKNRLWSALFVLLFLSSSAQAKDKWPLYLSGSIQSDVLFPQADSIIGAGEYNEFALTNTYVDLNLLSSHFDAGARFEYLKHPLPGFEPDFAGGGISHFYATGKFRRIQLTAGDFYDQFGSGLIFRTYEERSLGIDNSLRGGRLLYEPYKGIYFKALGGKQRRYWNHNAGLVWGSDLELNIDRWIAGLESSNTFLSLGGSFVSKNEPDEFITTDATHRLKLPQNVGAGDIRTRLQKGNYSLLAEYAWKANDPSFDNNYIYKNGSALLLSASYSKTGLSLLLQAKRSDNMAFRSARSQTQNSSFINFLPPFTVQQSYTLAAYYPYATQVNGEWAYQANFAYTFKRNTPLGGKHGTAVKLNLSYIRAIDKTYTDEYDGTAHSLKGTDGYTSSFFRWGPEIYYRDIHVMVDKTLSKSLKLHLMYMNQLFNQGIVQGHNDKVYANIFVAESKYRIHPALNLRSELQYLQTRQDKGDWIHGLLELSIHSSYMITLADTYNAGESHLHYYKALLSFSHHAHLLQIGYGRTREGYDCSGGICRQVPASKGLTLSYHLTF
jgi:hypothetical protein